MANHGVCNHNVIGELLGLRSMGCHVAGSGTRSSRYATLALFLVLIGCDPEPSVLHLDYSLNPVLLVHGSGLDARYWDALIRRLQGHGYPPAYVRAVEMLPSDGSNRVAAQRYIAPAVAALKAAAEHEAQRAGAPVPRQVDVVAHSMGAISSRWFISRIDASSVRRWIGIAPANHGTEALCGSAGAGDIEMCPAFSAAAEGIQAKLNGTPSQPRDETPFGVGADSRSSVRVPPSDAQRIAYFTLRIEPDRWVVPPESAVLDGAGGLRFSWPPDLPVSETSPGNFLFHARVEHDDLPADSRVIDWVLAVLKARENPLE